MILQKHMRVCMLFATSKPISRNRRDRFNCDLKNTTITVVYCVTNRQHFNFLGPLTISFVLKSNNCKKVNKLEVY